MRLNSPHHEVTLQSQRRIIRRSLSQSAGFLLARMSDVTHHPMSHITFAHNIPTSNTILRRNIKLPPIYNTKPIFATYLSTLHTSSMTPYERICQLMSRDGSVQNQSGLYQTMTPILYYNHLQTVNITCV